MKNQMRILQLFFAVVFATIGTAEMTAQTKHAVEEGKYIIRSAKDRTMVLDGTNLERGNWVKLKKRNVSRKGQIWRVRKVGGVLGGYTITCDDTGLVLDGDAAALTASLLSNNGNVIKLQMWDRTNAPVRTNQEWYIGKSDGFKTIFNIMNDRKYVDAKDDVSANSVVKLYNRNTANHDRTQQWVFSSDLNH